MKGMGKGVNEERWGKRREERSVGFLSGLAGIFISKPDLNLSRKAAFSEAHTHTHSSSLLLLSPCAAPVHAGVW